VTPRARLGRPLALAATLAASAGVLAACDKPLPEITLQSGSDTTTVTSQSYCFDRDHCHYRKSGGIGSLHVTRGATILVDVPKDVAESEWNVRSAQVVKNGRAVALQDAGVNSGIRKDVHTARVQVPTSTNSYYLVVTSADKAGQWVAKVSVSG
jgi:hypothetical protein